MNNLELLIAWHGAKWREVSPPESHPLPSLAVPLVERVRLAAEEAYALLDAHEGQSLPHLLPRFSGRRTQLRKVLRHLIAEGRVAVDEVPGLRGVRTHCYRKV